MVELSIKFYGKLANVVTGAFCASMVAAVIVIVVIVYKSYKVN